MFQFTNCVSYLKKTASTVGSFGAHGVDLASSYLVAGWAQSQFLLRAQLEAWSSGFVAKAHRQVGLTACWSCCPVTLTTEVNISKPDHLRLFFKKINIYILYFILQTNQNLLLPPLLHSLPSPSFDLPPHPLLLLLHSDGERFPMQVSKAQHI